MITIVRIEIIVLVIVTKIIIMTTSMIIKIMIIVILTIVITVRHIANISRLTGSSCKYCFPYCLFCEKNAF